MTLSTAVSAAAAHKPRVQTKGSLTETVRNLWPYIWPSDRVDLKMRVVWATVLLFAGKLVTMAIPYSFKWATDSVVGDAGLKAIPLPEFMTGAMALTVLYAVLRIVMALFTQGRDALFAAVAMNAVRRLAAEVFVHMHNLSLRYHLERKTGGLTRVLERGRAGIETIVRMSMLTAVPTLVEFVMILGVMFYTFDWRYALVVTLMIISYLWYTTVATNWRMAIRKTMNESDNDANTKAIDSLLNYETVKYFGAEKRESERYDKSMAKFEKSSIKTYTSLAMLNFGQAVIFTLGLAAVMAMCVAGIRSGHNTVGDVVLINTMMIQLSQPLNFMGMLYREVKQATIDIEAMFAILDQNPEIKDHPNAPALKVGHGDLQFDDVHFAYDPARPILKGVSFTVPAGHPVASVGPSGAGKSTLSRLLFRFYEPQAGRILIDGQDISAVQQKSLRAQIGMVPQDTVLFNDTIGYNIRYGRWEASDDEVREAARLAQIDTFIRSIPHGYDAQVGERGLKLSGGEKQRVAIARTILKSPPILVLDEATSALDSFTEREIQDELERISKGRTTLVIAHRLSTVVNADQIIVLDGGQIAERGTHEELLARGGIYNALWNRQREVDEAREKLKAAGAV